MQRISSRAASVALIVSVSIFVGWISLALTGHRTLVVMSGSMEPAIGTGDVAIVRTIAPADASVGDVVTFRDPTRGRQLVTHRAVYIRDMGSVYAFATKGDQNSSIEEWTVNQDGAIGRLQGRVPFVGYVLNWLASPLVRAAMIAGAFILLGLVAMRAALQLGGPALQRSAMLSLAALVGLGLGLKTLPTTLGALASSTSNPNNSFQAAASFCTPGSVVLSANADSYIDQDNLTTNYGTGTDLYVGRTGVPKNRRALVRFSLPDLGACAMTSATLQMYAQLGKTGFTLETYRLDGAWTETGVTWGNQPPITGSAATAQSGPGWRSWNVTDHVAAMYAGTNHGLIVRDSVESSGNEEQLFASRETALGPVLTVNYG